MIKFATKLPPDAVKVETAWKAGFRSAEVWLNAELLKNWRGAARALEARPISYVLHFPNKGPLKPRRVKKLVKLHRALKCRAVVIHPPMLHEYETLLRKWEPGLCLAVENGKWHVDDFWQWAEHYDYLTLDVEHLWKYSLKNASLGDLRREVRKFLAIYAGKLRHVHLPGYQPGGSEHRPTCRSPKMARAILDILEDSEYMGIVVSEARENLRKPRDLADDIRFFKNWSKRRADREPVLLPRRSHA